MRALSRRHPAHKAVEILTRLDPHFRVDLLVRTREQVRQRIELGDFFLREVAERGRVLYEALDRSGARPAIR